MNNIDFNTYLYLIHSSTCKSLIYPSHFYMDHLLFEDIYNPEPVYLILLTLFTEMELYFMDSKHEDVIPIFAFL